MPEPPREYDVVLSGPWRTARLLASAPDPDSATVAFHEALTQLRLARATGEVVLRARDGAERTLLRVPLRRGGPPGAATTPGAPAGGAGPSRRPS